MDIFDEPIIGLFIHIDIMSAFFVATSFYPLLYNDYKRDVQGQCQRTLFLAATFNYTFDTTFDYFSSSSNLLFVFKLNN